MMTGRRYDHGAEPVEVPLRQRRRDRHAVQDCATSLSISSVALYASLRPWRPLARNRNQEFKLMGAAALSARLVSWRVVRSRCRVTWTAMGVADFQLELTGPTSLRSS